MLIQQPQSYLHMQFLVPILMDSIRSNVKSWSERTLWLCLRTLIHAPIGIPIYGFIHIETPASINVLQQLPSAIRGTESMYRLVFAISKDLPFDLSILNSDECIDIDLSSENSNYIVAPDYFTESSIDLRLGPIESSATVTRNALTESTSIDTIFFQILLLRLQGLGRWAFIALTWVAYVMRPLTLQELDMILAFEDAKFAGRTLPVDIPRGSSARLAQVLPEIVGISSGRAFLCIPYIKMRHLLSILSGTYLPSDSSPHLHIAQTCLSFLITQIFNYTRVGQDIGARVDAELEPNEDDRGLVTQEATINTQAVNDTPQKENEEDVFEEPTANSLPPTKSQDWDVNEMMDLHQALAEYAGRNWMNHYLLAEVKDSLNDDLLSAFLGEETNVQRWLSIVEYFSYPHQRKTDHVNNGLEALYSLATRPSSFSKLGRLLFYAAELGDKTLLRSICNDIGFIERKAVTRAIATTSGNLHEDLIKAAALHLEKDPRILTCIQLTAQALGTNGTSENLMIELLSLPAGSLQMEWFSDCLKIAIEYGDEETTRHFLNNHDLVKCIDDNNEHRWTALHIAVHSGSLQAVCDLWEAGLTKSIDTLSRDERRPLLIGSSHGFDAIVGFLLSKGAYVEFVRSNLERMALHVASQYGFLETVKVLLSRSADVTAANAEGNFYFPLIPKLPVENVMGVVSEGTPPLNNPYHENSLIHDDEFQIDEISYEFEEFVDDELDYQETEAIVDDPANAPLNRANSEGRTVLAEAASRNLPSVVKYLLNRGVDPNFSNDLSLTALHLAARNGSVSIIQDLLDKGAEPNVFKDMQTQLKSLLRPAQILLYRTDGPVLAAFASGQLHAAQTLLPYYDLQQWPTSLISAASHGHRELVKYLLHLGCAINGKNYSANTALMAAARSSQSRMVQLFLTRGADLEVANLNSGDRAIHEAAQNELLETAKVLIDGGARLEIEGNSGQSPLTYAI
ncbi:Ankyrin-2 [Xylographa trunciseda]|nr:Ankyrin-2 [Xylographa trunciseda]